MESRINKHPFVMGVAGGSGSGKTFFLKCFTDHFRNGDICLLSQDDYYFRVSQNMTAEENKLYNFDEPDTIDNNLLISDINDLIEGKSILREEYVFNNPHAEPRLLEIKPAPIIIIEGLFILHFREIARLLDLKIFIEADEKIALQRRVKRDLLERGYPEEDVLYKWNNHVVPAYKNYLLPFRDQCDQVIINNSHDADDIVLITHKISSDLKFKYLNRKLS